MAVLRQLVRAGSPLRVSTLAKALGCTMSNISQIVGRLLVLGFVDLVTYEKKPTWRAVAINAEGRVALGEADADAAQRADVAFEELSPEERAQLESLLSRLRCPKAQAADPGEPRVIVSGRAVRKRPMTLDQAEVAKRTPPDPIEEARKKREELIARASQQDPSKLQHWELKIWDFESRGLPAPDIYYEDAEFFRELMADSGDARSPP
jgi:DNA-binding MarR family transcriptional regulator